MSQADLQEIKNKISSVEDESLASTRRMVNTLVFDFFKN